MLLADALDRAPGGDGMRIARVTFDFMGPVPLVPLCADVRVLRAGRRFAMIEGELSDGEGQVLLRARAVRLRVGAIDVPSVALPPALPARAADPRSHPVGPFDDRAEAFQRTGMEVRLVYGSYAEPGPAAGWFRLAVPFTDERAAPSAVGRVVAAADFGNGIGSAMAWETSVFANVDLSVHLLRAPAGEWVLVQARTAVDRAGVGQAVSMLYDERGAIGTAAQTLFVDAR